MLPTIVQSNYVDYWHVFRTSEQCIYETVTAQKWGWGNRGQR